jgi:hypothetical protein
MDNSGLLRYESRVIIPEDPVLRGEIIKLHYNDPLAGHYGVEKTLELLKRSWYWENMETDIRVYCKEYDICQRVKAKRHMPYSLLSSLPQPERPWGEISMDFVIGLLLCKNPAGGPDFDTILIIINRYSKMARYITCNKIVNFPELAKLIWENVFLLFDISDRIVSDRGTVFTSHFWSTFYYYLIYK